MSDFDGTLSPIVQDRAQAHIAPSVREALIFASRSAGVVVWILTSRPASEVQALSGMPDVRLPITIVGLCGAESIDPEGRREPVDRPAQWDEATRNVKRVFRELGVSASAALEVKQTAVTIHTRGLQLDRDSLDSLHEQLADIGRALGWLVDFGKEVVELRPSSLTKGNALRQILETVDPEVAVYVGDDAVDASAFRALRDWRDRREGRTTLGVLVVDPETDGNIGPVDLTVHGQEGLAHWIAEFVDRYSKGRASMD